MNQKRKIILVGNTSWSMYNFRLGAMRALKNIGYEIHVAAPYDQTTELLKQEGFIYHSIYVDSKGTSPIKDFRFFRTLLKLYKEIDPDLCIHYTIKPNIYGSIVAKLQRITSIACVTGLGQVFVDNGWLSFLVKSLYKIAFKYPNLIWFLNADDVELFINQNLVKREKTEVLPSEGINTTFFYPQKNNQSDRPYSFLFFGRLLWSKGIGEFVNAARKMKGPQLQFYVLGFVDNNNPASVSSNDIEDWEKEGIIIFLGATDDVRKYIAQSHCVVMPSYYREGVPRNLLEAASMAKPIITSNHVGCKEVVKDGVTGFLCKTKDSDDLCEKMNEMISLSDTERFEMGQASRKYVLWKFDEKIIIDKYIQMVQQYL